MLLALFLFLIRVISVRSLFDYPHITYHILYEKGVEAYGAKEWYPCISFLRRAIEDHKFFQDNIIKCYEECSLIESNYAIHQITDEFQYYLDKINTTLCLTKCRNDKFQYRPLINHGPIDEAFDNLIPYEFLQYCYFKINDLENAVSHAYTYYLKNPHQDLMLENLHFYQSLPNYEEKYLKNLELQYHQEFYLNGVNAYNEGKWEEAIDYFQEALDQYYIKDKRCRLLCYGPFKKVFVYDFLSTIANLYALILKCNKKCIYTLNTLPGQYSNQSTGQGLFLDDYLRSHYHYLQFCYYKIGDYITAAKHVATYFIFDPMDQDMIGNKKFYMASGYVNQSDFRPFQDAIDYHNRHYRESALLEFIEDNFNPYLLGKVLPPKDLKNVSQIETLIAKKNESVQVKLTNQKVYQPNGSIIVGINKSFYLQDMTDTCPLL